MLHYAFCLSNDSEYIKKIIAGYNKEKYIQYTFWGNESLQTEFWNSISSNSLLSKPKLILIRNAHKIVKEEYLAIERFLIHSESIFCVFAIEQDTIPSHIQSSQLYSYAVENKQIHKQIAITKKTISQYIKDYCNANGYEIEQQALAYLREILPCTLSAIHNECNKYMLYAETKKIDINIVKDVTSYQTEYSIWQFIDEILGGRDITSIWNTILEQCSFFTISAMLQRELRIAGAILSNDTLSLQPYLLEKKQRIAKQLQYKGIAQIFTILLEMEHKIKSGEITESQALEYSICYIPYIIYNSK